QDGLGRGSCQPELAGAQEVQASTKTCFHNSETAARLPLLPAGRQRIACKKHMTAFLKAIGAGKIDIVESGRHGLAVPPLQMGGFQVVSTVLRVRIVGHLPLMPSSASSCRHQSEIRWSESS